MGLNADTPRILVDTNILLRLFRLDILQSAGDMAEGKQLESILLENYIPCITFQNLTEYWSVAGRSASDNGFGFSPEDIAEQITRYRKTFDVLPEEPEAVDIWLELCKKYRVSGKRVHDVRLAASALSNGINRVLTLNTKDFENFEELQVLTPTSLLNQESKEGKS